MAEDIGSRKGMVDGMREMPLWFVAGAYLCQSR